MAQTQKIRNLGHLSRDTGYRFMDADPVLEFIRNDITDSGWSARFLAERAGVSVGTITAWQKGTTKRPQNATVDAVLTALGWDRRVHKVKGWRST